ncbi:MAG: protein-tyrosine phosphatase family protein [Caulobacteraceae bacterium]
MTAPFDWITPKLAIGGCWDALSAAELAAASVGAVVDLRNEAADDAAGLAACGVRFLHLPTPDLQPPTSAMLDQGVAFAQAARADGRRLLVHCQHGIGRGPLLGLCVMVSWGEAPLDALSRAKDARARVSPSPAQYEAWAAWLEDWRVERGASWTVPSFEAFAAIAYRHLVPS